MEKRLALAFFISLALVLVLSGISNRLIHLGFIATAPLGFIAAPGMLAAVIFFRQGIHSE